MKAEKLAKCLKDYPRAPERGERGVPARGGLTESEDDVDDVRRRLSRVGAAA